MLLNHVCYEQLEITHYISHPLILNTVSVICLVLISIYSLATVMFGLRFSNLTNRGIITSGPYKIVRHPAYIAKNTFWWFAMMPWFVSSGVNCIGSVFILIVLNAFYVWRALTEEKHLMREEHYQEYCQKWSGVLFRACFKTLSKSTVKINVLSPPSYYRQFLRGDRFEVGGWGNCYANT